jgi:hypothetical protein
MTKVNVDVQILITGPAASGKGLVMNRLREFLSKQVSNGITQKHSFQNYFADGVTFSLDGELLQSTGPKSPKQTHSNVPGYPDTDKMLDYLSMKVSHTELMKELLNYEYDKPVPLPFKVVIDHTNGTVLEWREGETLHAKDRVVTLLTASPADAPANPVGMDQPEPKDASIQPSFNEPGPVMAGGGYVDRCALITPIPKEKSTLERLPGETDVEYRNRNKLNRNVRIPLYVPIFTSKVETETGAPEPDAHNKALDALLMLNPSIADRFQTITYEETVYPGGLVAGNKVQLIFDDGAIVIGTAGEFAWRKGQATADIVYWRRM